MLMGEVLERTSAFWIALSLVALGAFHGAMVSSLQTLLSVTENENAKD
jgi:hypothetical protein